MSRATIHIRHKVRRLKEVVLPSKHGPRRVKIPFEVEETTTVSLDRAIYEELGDQAKAAIAARTGLKIVRMKVEMEDA